jgi:hypothetical protein
MFCPKCGTADQQTETYCRSCGIFLPDFDKAIKKEIAAEEHIKINSVFSVMSAVVSLGLAITLYSTLAFRPDTPWIIYVVTGFLTAMTAWQVQTFIRTRMLKKQIAEMKPPRQAEAALPNAAPAGSLPEADFENIIPASVVERTTRNLSETKVKSDRSV